ncbi:MAG: LptF/LptG family permease [Planctomycetes bacterium]|nr:LptF/LptG family permease [Planctomycetota bacterium]
MTLLDRYVGRIVAGAFGACLLFFLFLTILLDLLNNLPRYVDRAAEQGFGGMQLAVYLGLYYLKLLPVLFTTVTPFVTVIACMFAVARLQQANEVVAMLFVGRSIQRILAPMLVCGACAGLAMAACWQWVVPHVGAALAADETFLRRGSAVQTNLVHEVRGEIDQFLYVSEFDPVAKTLRGVRMLTESALAIETTLVSAPVAVWDPERRDWRLAEGKAISRERDVPQAWLQRPDVTPEILLQRSRDTIDPEILSYTDLLELVESRPNRADVRLALHRHFTHPLGNLLLLLLALPMAIWYERGSRTERLLLAIALCGGFTMLDITCQNLGSHGLLHPVVAAWSPTIVFGALGAVLFGGTRT